MSDDDNVEGIVLDNGSWKIKAGFAGDDAPRAVFPCLLGTPHNQVIQNYMEKIEMY